MIDNTILPMTSPLVRSNFSAAGRGGDSGELRFTDRRGLALGQVFARAGKEKELVERLDLPLEPGRSHANAEYVALPLAPRQWMLIAESGADGSFCSGLRERIGELGYISEQSHSRAVIRVSGTRARDLLCKGCRLDLHPSVMQPGFCATSIMAHVGVLLHQVDETPSYDLLVYAGFARSFWEWLEESALEFGFTTEVEQRQT